jgi:hypothetical protein
MVAKNGDMEGNGVVTLYSEEYITDDGLVGGHDLADMLLPRDVFSITEASKGCV